MKRVAFAACAAVVVLAGCAVGRKCAERSASAPRDFGTTKFGERARLYTLKGDGALTLEVTDFGGRLVRCLAPDREGKTADVTLGWNTVGEYETLGFSMGTLIGRYGNRIADGKFSLDGKVWQFPVNETSPSPRHCNLHSGPVGWDAKVWKVSEYNGKRLVLTLVSPDGDMGFPGTVTMKVTYSVLSGNVWRIEYEATADSPTVINPTHHSYWNLAGEASGNVLGQMLKVNADKYTQTDAGLIPTKDAPVDGTGFDFRKPRAIGAMARWMASQESLRPMDNWYDHNFFLRGKTGEMKQAATMRDPVSGRKMEVWTTEPCMQIYGAQNMDGTMPAKEAGKKLVKCAGMALETQHAPDSPNRPDFPSTVLRPGERFKSRTEYRFFAE